MAKTKKNEISFEDLEKTIRRKEYKPLYYFFGEEDFLFDGLVKDIVDGCVEESVKCFNLDMLDGSSIDVRDLLSIVSSYPMMSDKRVVIVRDMQKIMTNESNRELLERYFDNPSESTVLIMKGSKLDNRTSVAKALKENGIIFEFTSLYENQIPAWIKSRAKQIGIGISEEGAVLLAQYVSGSMREIHGELEKLSIYVGDKKYIEAEDVNSIVGISKVYNIFALQKTIGMRDTKKSISIMENMLENGESVLGAIVLLTKYFQKLWVLKSNPYISDADIMKNFGISQYFIKDYRTAADEYSLKEIENVFEILIKTDESLKTGKTEEKLAMTLMVYNIISQGRAYPEHT